MSQIFLQHAISIYSQIYRLLSPVTLSLLSLQSSHYFSNSRSPEPCYSLLVSFAVDCLQAHFACSPTIPLIDSLIVNTLLTRSSSLTTCLNPFILIVLFSIRYSVFLPLPHFYRTFLYINFHFIWCSFDMIWSTYIPELWKYFLFLFYNISISRCTLLPAAFSTILISFLEDQSNHSVQSSF